MQPRDLSSPIPTAHVQLPRHIAGMVVSCEEYTVSQRIPMQMPWKFRQGEDFEKQVSISGQVWLLHQELAIC